MIESGPGLFFAAGLVGVLGYESDATDVCVLRGLLVWYREVCVGGGTGGAPRETNKEPMSPQLGKCMTSLPPASTNRSAVWWSLELFLCFKI